MRVHVWVVILQIKAAISLQVSPGSSSTDEANKMSSATNIPAEGDRQSSLVPSPSFGMDKHMSIPKAELNWIQVPMVRSSLLMLMKNIVKLSGKSKL